MTMPLRITTGSEIFTSAREKLPLAREAIHKGNVEIDSRQVRRMNLALPS